ncbi:MAG: EcsC family protein [Oscillospiraceae bacterium]|nr:EcsC family protein [Oscillospiraceae bacterium]
METKHRALIRRELLKIQSQEQKLRKKAEKAKPVAWKSALEEKIPEKVYVGLEKAFCTGFKLVFQHGRKLIELTYRKGNIQQEHILRDQAVQAEASRRDFKQMQKNVRKAGAVNMAVTTAEGVALGALGVGMPDVVLFLATLLKGIYETALHYGFEYDTPAEQYLILKMMSASLKTGKAWLREDAKVDALLCEDAIGMSQEILTEQIQKTASAFAMDMLVLKFIQGIPVVGFLGGAANPVYYGKVMEYVQRKYRKRYLLRQLK